MKLALYFYVVCLCCSILSFPATSKAQAELRNVQIKPHVKLDVPLIKQRRMLCGPTVIEMLFRYWGVARYTQEDIALNILRLYPDVERVKKSGILESEPLDLGRYPGTGTSIMRKFLRRFARTYNSYLEELPADQSIFHQKRLHHFNKLKKNLSNGVPVIVHQISPRNPKRGHYLVVTGYDDIAEVVYLNDPASGTAVKQFYSEFLRLWNFNARWLHFNALAFNFDKKPVQVRLPYRR